MILSKLPFFCALAVLAMGSLGRASEPGPQDPPPFSSLLKPKIYTRILQDREVMTHASLDAIEGPGPKSQGSPPLKRYQFYAAMLVKASLGLTRQVLTHYSLYAEMIPYVRKAEYEAARNELLIQGGIWKFELSSKVRFEERGPRAIHYQIIDGHFKGMVGDIFFESQGEKGTFVYFRGESTGRNWPPALVIERGAEIVFGFTAKRMRSYIESEKAQGTAQGSAQKNGQDNGKEKDGREESGERSQIPQPRRHL